MSEQLELSSVPEIPKDPKEPKPTIVYDLDIRKSGTTRIQVTLNENRFFPFYLLADARTSFGGGFTIPLEESPHLFELLTEKFPHYKYTISDDVREYIERYLKKAAEAALYALAEDCHEIPKEFGKTGEEISFHSHQRAAIRFLEYTNSCGILALDMGLGKTAVAIALAERNNYRTLFLTKAALVLNLEREIRKLTNHTPVILNGRFPEKTTMQALLMKDQFKYFILNYEVVGTEVLDKEGKVESRPWADAINLVSEAGFLDFIVADEAHVFKNMKAKRTKAILSIKTPHKMPMTGTPLVNRTNELFPSLHWIDPITFPSFDSFVNTYDDGKGGVKDPKALQKALQPYLFRRAKKDVLKDLPPIIRNNHYSQLNAFHKERYDTALEMIYLTLEEKEMDINNMLAQLTRLRQIVADAKVAGTIEYYNNIREESDDKVLIFSNFTGPVKEIARAIGCNAIYGDVPNHKRMEYVDDFNNNPDTKCLVLSIATGQEGLNLTAAKQIIFNDFSFVPKDITQAEARCYGRMNDIHGAISTWHIIKDTVDELLLSLISTKMKRAEQAIEGVNENNREEVSVVSEFISKLKTMR